VGQGTPTMRTLFTAALLSILLCSCVTSNGFLDNYKGTRYEPLSQSEAHCVSDEPPTATPIGQARFIGCHEHGDAYAEEAAAAIGADLVRWTSEYKGTTQSSGVMPFTTPTTNTTNFSGTTYGNVYGNYGAASYTANTYGTATTYGTQTTYIPYT